MSRRRFAVGLRGLWTREANGSGGTVIDGLLAEFDKVPALGLINARLMLTKIPLGGPGQTDASFWVRNLADSKKMVNLIDFAFFRNAAWTPPRTFGVSLSYKW